MRTFVYSMALACIIIFLPLSASADAFGDYLTLRSGYYSFGNQDFKRVTCHLSLSTLDPVQLREQFKPIAKNVRLDENLKDFSVTYSRQGGITFVKPRVELVVVSTEGATDPRRLETGVKMVNEGAKQQIEGSTETVKGILSDFLLPKRSELTNIEFSSDGDRKTVKYNPKGTTVTEVYFGTKRVREWTSDYRIEATEQFTKLGGKLALAKSVMQMVQGQTTNNVTVLITYQQLGKLYFPSVMEGQTQMSAPNMKQQAEFKITFADCHVE